MADNGSFLNPLPFTPEMLQSVYKRLAVTPMRRNLRDMGLMDEPKADVNPIRDSMEYHKEELPMLSGDQRLPYATMEATMNATPLQQEDWYRSQFFPVETREGEARLAWPGMIKQPWDAWNRQWESALGYGEGVTQDQVFDDALSVSSTMIPGAMAKGGVAKATGFTPAMEEEGRGIVRAMMDKSMREWLDENGNPKNPSHLSSDFSRKQIKKLLGDDDIGLRAEEWMDQLRTDTDKWGGIADDLANGGDAWDALEKINKAKATHPSNHNDNTLPDAKKKNPRPMTDPNADIDDIATYEAETRRMIEDFEESARRALKKSKRPNLNIVKGNKTIHGHVGSPFAGMVGDEEDRR